MISIYEDNDRLVISGHAGAAPKGEDLVCAAVTILIHSLNAMIADEPIEVELAEGKYTLRGKGSVRAQTALEMAMCGLKLLAEHYPECVKIK